MIGATLVLILALEREFKSGKGFSLVKLLKERVSWWKDKNKTVFKDKFSR